jgi:uncharacterized protein YkwD
LLLAVLATVVVAALAPAAAGARCRDAGARPGQVSNTRLAAATRCLVNVERRHYGLRKLRTSRSLTRAARRHARDMAIYRFFSHTSPWGASSLERIASAGYLRGARNWSVGENIAWGSGWRGSPREIVRSWMQSPGHRSNILDRGFRQLGLGVALGSPEGMPSGAFFVNTFGARR